MAFHFVSRNYAGIHEKMAACSCCEILMLGGIKNMKTLNAREKEIIGKNIRAWRKRCGFTQASLAQEMGKTVDHIAHVESGRNGVSMRMLFDICAVLGVSPNDVLEGAYNKGLE